MIEQLRKRLKLAGFQMRREPGGNSYRIFSQYGGSYRDYSDVLDLSPTGAVTTAGRQSELGKLLSELYPSLKFKYED